MAERGSASRWSKLWPWGLFLALALLALGPALAHGPLWSARYDWRYFETMTEMARRTVVEYHQVPLWNPYSCGGEVGLANPQAMDGAPTFLLVLLFGTAWGFKLALLGYLLAALHGGFVLGRRLGLGALPAAFAAVSFGLSGYLAMHLSSGHINFAGVALYPYLLYCYDRAIERWEWAIPAGAFAAWIALLGGTFTPPMAGELLFLWATVDALIAAPVAEPASPQRGVLLRLGRNYALLLLCAAVALGLAAARMLPALEFIIDHPRGTFRRTPDVSSLRQLLTDLWFWRDFGPLAGRRYWSHEYTARLPILVAPLLVLTLPPLLRGRQSRRLGQLWVLAVVSALLAMGNFAPWAPWSLLQKLPVLRDLRVPSRHLVLTTLWLALLGGLGAQVLLAWLRERRGARWAAVVGVTLLLVGGIDAAVFFAHSFRDVFTVSIALPKAPVRFYHVKGHWSQMRDLMLQGHGVLGCDEEAPLQRAEALDEDDTPQERLLDPGAGTITKALWSPNRREITVDLQRSDTLLLLNSNWNEHWRPLDPRTPIVKLAGRLTVDLHALGPGQHTVGVRYAPRSFSIGLLISAVMLPLCLLGFLRRRRAWKSPPG